ncbi:bifunctional metallophosphatase/5'-nucleotidase [Comamonas thiooxydans]|uniref:bifunctional metallophosphatase/5'-nucleotidase n=1 Tax=Comamonas thiooxydans TaxID=363952 RepID=UPI0005F81ADC|nr:bifunctional metallophosphatase/5'-nucleotidase [Comamonas thiooxydans]CUA98464.1 2',3'-cyclic-nucleotide 2'-phosphodiesterase/5'-or 3'-nucleotidase, 5'-nucleotidase family [Comamonas thiooxydans]
MVSADKKPDQRQPRALSPGWRCALRNAFRPMCAGLLVLGLSACGGGALRPASMEITLLGFNDLHGHLEPPRLAVTAQNAQGQNIAVPAGGVAYMARAIAQRRQASRHVALVTAGDMIGASPMVSALFLDEPTIEVLNLMRVDFAATGNHEYDQGVAELLRMQHGGCEKFTSKQPCQISQPFKGAEFPFLAANTLREDGRPLFPATGLKFFEQDGLRIGVGFIGMTLRNTPHMVRPSGVEGLTFADEAQTANALIPQLRAQGADVIVVLIHEGGATTSGLQDDSCQGLSGAIVPILEQLSGEVDVVISGHTHRSYICDYARVNARKPFLLTSAGQYGTLLTEVRLTVDARTRRVSRKSAHQTIVQGEAYRSAAGLVSLQPEFPVLDADAPVAALVARYKAAARPLAEAVAGQLAGPVSRVPQANGESVMGRIVADAILAATRDVAAGGAQLAFVNPGGVRADLLPAADGSVTYGQLFSVQPFGNTLMVMSLTGEQIRQALEQQFDSGSNTVNAPRILQVSEGFSYRFDRRLPAGRRVSELRLNGRLLKMSQRYRVGLQSYLGSGGDNFSIFTQGIDVVGGMLDLDALAEHVHEQSRSGPMALPLKERVTRVH